MSRLYLAAPARVPWGRPANRRSPVLDRFWHNVRPEGECWRWVGHINPQSGYGYIGLDRKVLLVHRWAYETWNGPIPHGLHIDHLCRNRWCVKPAHLEAVTQGENNARAWAARPKATHCPQGHPYIRRNGVAVCRECHIVSGRKWRASQKASS